MVSKNLIKRVQSLSAKKFRQKEGLFIAEGKKVIEELLDSNYTIERLFITEENEGFARQYEHTEKVELISEKELKQLSGLKTPAFGLALVHVPKEQFQLDFKQKGIVLFDIQDPGNVGTILRTAEWFGFGQVLLTQSCADIFSPKVVQASMGSLFRLKTAQMPFLDIQERLSSRLLFCDLNGDNLYRKQFYGTEWFVFGNEGHGFESLDSATFNRITIPRFGKTESLNVAQSAAVVLSHFSYLASNAK